MGVTAVVLRRAGTIPAVCGTDDSSNEGKQRGKAGSHMKRWEGIKLTCEGFKFMDKVADVKVSGRLASGGRLIITWVRVGGLEGGKRRGRSVIKIISEMRGMLGWDLRCLVKSQ